MARLLPFGDAIDGLRLNAQFKRKGSLVELEYRLEGPRISEVAFPGVAPLPSRQDKLWEHTCFEAFLSEPGQQFYWELNFSPSQDWNVYHFRNYREGMRPESRVTAIELQEFERGPAAFELSASIDLSKLVSDRSELDLSLTAVVELKSGEKSYWAFAHAGDKPDFHLRKSLELKL